MRKFLLLTILFVGFTISGWAQNEHKFSPSTLMFLSERNGETQLQKANTRIVDRQIIAQNLPVDMTKDPALKKPKLRPIADVEQVNGTDMISAFVAVNDNNFSAIESLGAVIQSKFKNLVAALLPVDKIEDVAALSNVTKIEVAEVLDVVNDRQRTATQAGDAMTNSAAAQALGLTKQYTGKGVILGIIDTGVDFQHIAFKDKNGNSRIVRAYKLSGSNSTSLTTYSSASQISGLTYDTNLDDHGTHTSSTAGGSSVIVNGTSVTVTDDHANATYGGMAPEADLVIAGLSTLYTTSIGTAIQNICNYADQVGKPCVISLSLGSQVGPHDGTGTIASIVNQYAGKNHIIVYASSNDAMRNYYFMQNGTSSGGGMYASGVSTSSKPMMANIQRSWADATGNVQLYPGTIYAYARNTNVATALKFHVVNVKTGAVVYSSSAYTTGTTINMTGSSGLAAYFYTSSNSQYANPYGDTGSIRIARSTSSNKYLWTIYTPLLVSRSYSDEDGDEIYDGEYALCVSVYPTSSGSSTTIDMWEAYGVNWFGNDVTLSSSDASKYNLVKGSDDCSVSDDACNPNVISVGAYVTKNSITDYAGTTHDWSSEYPNIGDHASFSSYQTAGYGPTGTALPTISAPGARIVAGINHYHTKSVDESYSYWADDFISDLVVNNTTYPYAAMEGTSMATPCVSGIIAQWLQACLEAGKTPTPDYIKEVMAATWDTDEWTNGTGAGAHGAKTFGTHGKINAIKGLQYILGTSASPTVTADPAALEFTGYATVSQSQDITVKGMNLEGNITASLSGSNVFSINKTTITQNSGTAEATITVTWNPTTAGTTTATLTLKSSNADDVTVSLTGTAEAATPTIIADKESVSLRAVPNMTSSQTVTVTSRFLSGNVTANLSDTNGVFAVNPTSFTAGEEGTELTISFNPTEEGNYTATLTLSSDGADDVVIPITATAKEGGTASDPYLDIAQYETIDEAGWNTSYINKLYQYTKYEDDECAWLTMPVYGGWVGVYYDNHHQQWIESSLGTGTYGGYTWSASGIYPGSSEYFTVSSGDGRARMMGSSTANNTTQIAVSFYVTNTTGVSLYGAGINGTSNSYPAALKIYECTMNTDGTVTAVDDATKNLTSSSTTTFTLDVTGLDTSKIYKVEASIYRGYLYEIGFQTPIEVDRTPRLTAEPATLTFACYATQEVEQTITVKGKYLVAPVTATLNDENNAFTLKTESVSADEGNNGATFTVAFTPSEAGEFNATLTLKSEGAEDITVSLSGTAGAATPTILTETTELSFIANVDTPTSKDITVNGRFLAENVTATITDPKHVFSVSPASVEVTEEGTTITVTFEASAEGDYTGTLTLSCTGAEDVTIALSATANDGGTASDPYLNIAKYATIDEAGWNTTYVNKLYAYTEYEDEEVAWLTLPVYGAFVGARYATNSTTIGSGQPQKWIESNVSNTNQCGNVTWTNSDIHLGSNSYFSSATAKAVGTNSQNSKSEKTVTFYVTNTTAVKLNINQRSTSTTYPTTLNVYECTVNEDGTLTAASTATKNISHSTAGSANLSITDLDAAKVYKVVASQARGYLYEIAFQTPLKKETTLVGDVNRDGSISIADVTALVDIILGKITDTEAYDFTAADVNGDGTATIADVTALVDLILGK